MRIPIQQDLPLPPSNSYDLSHATRGKGSDAHNSSHEGSSDAPRSFMEYFGEAQIEQMRAVYSTDTGVKYGRWVRSELLRFQVHSIKKVFNGFVLRFEKRLITNEIFLNTETHTLHHETISIEEL